MIRLLLALGVATVLAARPAGAEWASATQAEVPLDNTGGAWRVRATLDGGMTGLFLLDTGASLCVIAPTLARRLDLAPGGQAQLQTANGVVTAPIVRLRTIDVGGNRAHDVLAVVHAAVPPPLDGIIGLSFLDRFTYSVDPRRRTLRLH